MKCSCPKWLNNIYVLNAPYTLRLTAIGEYDGDAFEYCPWCGQVLVEDAPPEEG
jgi:hypothetical protein